MDSQGSKDFQVLVDLKGLLGRLVLKVVQVTLDSLGLMADLD